MADKALFENLADQAAPERPRGKPRLQEPRRDQVALRAVDLEGLVAADDPVRDVWAYVERLDLTAQPLPVESGTTSSPPPSPARR